MNAYGMDPPRLIRSSIGRVVEKSHNIKRRTYDATARRAQSAGTRQRIVDTALALLLERGYRATTVAAVASGADVSVDTVYELVGRKPTLLREVIEQAISGTDRAVAADERDYVKAMQAEPDPARTLDLYAAAMRGVHARMAPLALALRDASTTEPEALEVWQEITNRRAENMRRLARNLRDADGLRDDLSIEEAGDILWATNSPELYVLLVHERSWTPQRYETWLADTWARLLMPNG
jgi:AcrR family transcriptional regulator